MGERTRNGSEEVAETLTPEHVLAVIHESDAPTVTARDVADALDCPPERVTKKLKMLREQGRVERRKVGNQATEWWLTNPEQSPDNIGEHTSDDPFFAGEPFDAEGKPIDVADIDELLGDTIALDE